MPYADPEAQRAYQRDWIAQRRAEYLADKSCIDCASSVSLEIDHLDRSKKVSHRIWSWAEDRRAAELAKCVVRCHQCHVDKTHVNGEHGTNYTFEHGTRSSYQKRRCRCPECRAWNAQRVAQQQH